VAFVRTVKTASGATAVQIVWSWRRGSRSIEHLGSAHDEVELAALKTAAAARLTAGQTELDLGLTAGVEPGTLPITSSRMSHLWDALCVAYRVLGFDLATKGDNVFRDLVLARIIEPTSKIDASRVLTEVGVDAASYATVKRRLPVYAQPSWRVAAKSMRRTKRRRQPTKTTTVNRPAFDAHLLSWEGAFHAEQVRPGDAGQGRPVGAGASRRLSQ
jgi:hypothetical protein